jgi:hypothetical protein
MIWRILIVFIVFLSCFPQVFAAQQCSPYITKATINEVFFKKTGVDRASFIEIKILDGALAAATYNQWHVKLCSGINNCNTINVSSAASGSTLPWLYFEAPSLVDSHIDFKNGFDLSLLDENDDVIDYIQINNQAYQSSSCPDGSLAHVFPVPTTQKGTKLIHRVIDGTGAWVKVNASQQNSPGSGNTGDAVFPYISIMDATAVEGNNVVFTINLTDINGAVTTSNSIINFNYQTVDGTALAGTHYNGITSTSASIPANTSSIALSVATTYIGDNTSRAFDLFISSSASANISDDTGLGTITPVTLASCGPTFIDGLTNSTTNGSITFEHDSILIGNLDSILASGSVNNNGFANTCWSAGVVCTAGGNSSIVEKITGNFITGSSSDDFEADGTTKTINANDFNEVIAKNSGTINFSSGYSDYTIKKLTVEDSSTVYMTAGDYYVEELIIKGSGASFLKVSGLGTVRIWVKNSAKFSDSSWLNDGATGDPSKLFLYFFADADTSVKIESSAHVAAYLYSQKDVEITSSGARFYGAISAEGNILVKDDSQVWYKNKLSDTDFGGACDAPSIDHFEIIHDGNGLTCNAESVTIKACTNTHGGTCTESTEAVTLSFKAEGVTKSTPTFTGNTTFSFNHIVVNPAVTLSIDSPTITPTNSLVCINSGDSNNSCDMNFTEAGFLLTLANHQSCTTPNLTIKAVRLSDSGLDCAPAYSGDQSVNFVFNYANPSIGTKVPSLATVAMAANTITQNRTINFDGTGTADLSFNYQDAGQIRIDVSDAASAGLSSSSVTTVVSPAKITVTSPDTNADCVSGDATCSTFKKAGEDFNLSLTAVCDDVGNTVTKNFEMDNIALSVNTVAPVSGNPVTLGVSSVTFKNSTINGHVPDNGKEDITQTISEVGVFTITATPLAGGYFGETVTGGVSANIGRFTPDRFELVSTVNGDFKVAPGNYSFAYIGQKDGADGAIKYSIEPSFVIKAVNTAGGETLNYTVNNDIDPTKDFMKLTGVQVVLSPITTDATANGVDGTLIDIDSIISGVLVGGNGSNGQLTFTMDDTNHFTYQHIANSKVAPILLSDIDIVIDSIDDGEGTLLADTNGNALAGVLKLDPVGVPVRFGRWNIENGYGPETEDLTLPMQIQHWDGNQFVTNTLDSYTSYDASVIGNRTINNTGLNPALDPTLTNSSGTGIFTLGLGQIVLSKPSDIPASQGQVRFIYTDTPLWLKYNWSGGSTYTDNPSGIAAFGLYRGNDRIISWREVGN